MKAEFGRRKGEFGRWNGEDGIRNRTNRGKAFGARRSSSETLIKLSVPWAVCVAGRGHSA